jgi:flavin reductase (DIM6/NTAB) family NADH-FMN oxidoreductase RutF
MSDYLEFDPANIEKRQVYRLLTGAVVPRPIGWASTLSTSGISNLAPFSFFTVVCVIPYPSNGARSLSGRPDCW